MSSKATPDKATLPDFPLFSVFSRADRPHVPNFPFYLRKIPAPIKIKSAPPPPKPKIPPPPKTRNFMDTGFPAERRQKFQAPIKLAQAFPAPELRTRILRPRGFFRSIGLIFAAFQGFCGLPGDDPHVPHILWIESEEIWDDRLCQGWLWVQPTEHGRSESMNGNHTQRNMQS